MESPTVESIINLYTDKPLPPVPKPASIRSLITRSSSRSPISPQSTAASSRTSTNQSSPLTPIYSKFVTERDILSAAKKFSRRSDAEQTKSFDPLEQVQIRAQSASEDSATTKPSTQRCHIKPVPFTEWRAPAYRGPSPRVSQAAKMPTFSSDAAIPPTTQPRDELADDVQDYFSCVRQGSNNSSYGSDLDHRGSLTEEASPIIFSARISDVVADQLLAMDHPFHQDPLSVDDQGFPESRGKSPAFDKAFATSLDPSKYGTPRDISSAETQQEHTHHHHHGILKQQNIVRKAHVTGPEQQSPPRNESVVYPDRTIHDKASESRTVTSKRPFENKRDSVSDALDRLYGSSATTAPGTQHSSTDSTAKTSIDRSCNSARYLDHFSNPGIYQRPRPSPCPPPLPSAAVAAAAAAPLTSPPLSLSLNLKTKAKPKPKPTLKIPPKETTAAMKPIPHPHPHPHPQTPNPPNSTTTIPSYFPPLKPRPQTSPPHPPQPAPQPSPSEAEILYPAIPLSPYQKYGRKAWERRGSSSSTSASSTSSSALSPLGVVLAGKWIRKKRGSRSGRRRTTQG